MKKREWIEQAVFTSAVTDRAAGYQVVAASPGLCEEDIRELAVRGPSHGALLDPGPTATSINFHPLPSGAYCVSRTTAAGWEYSGRGGARVYTQCLAVPRPVLARFANNPFAVVRAALASGMIRVYDDVPPRLEAFRLPGRASAVDVGLLTQLRSQPGAEWMACLIQATLGSTSLGLAAGPSAERLIAGIIQCFPPRCRRDLSFSTGLRFSSRRPFRIFALADEVEEQRRVQRLYNLPVLRPAGDRPEEPAVDSWPRLIERVLKSGRPSFLAAQLSKRQLEVDFEELSAFGLQLLEEFDQSRLQETSREHSTFEQASAASPSPKATAPADLPDAAPEAVQAHAAHDRFEKAQSSSAVHHADAPANRLEAASPAVRRRLRQLDALVYEAVSGNADAVEQLKATWAKIRQDLGDAMLARSREAYLRYALTIWEECLEPDGVRDPDRAVQSLDVLCVLFDEV